MAFDKTATSSSNASVTFDPPPTILPTLNLQFRLARTASVVLAVVCLATSAGVLGGAAHALAIRNATTLPPDFLLPLWPASLDGRPAVALVVCSVVILLTAAMSITAGRLDPASRTRPFLVIATPLAGLVAALITTAVAYAIESSAKADSIQSWSCRWSNLSMMQPPYFNLLCQQSHAALYLSVMLIPVELLAITTAALQLVFRRENESPGQEKDEFLLSSRRCLAFIQSHRAGTRCLSSSQT